MQVGPQKGAEGWVHAEGEVKRTFCQEDEEKMEGNQRP